jgi:hypothetical protein
MFENLQWFRVRYAQTAVFFGVVVLCLFAASCGQPPTQTPTPAAPAAPTGSACMPYGFSNPTFPPSAVTSTVPAARFGNVCLTGQTFSGTISFTLDFQGFRDSIAVCVPDGSFTFSTQALNPVNNTCAGPISPPVTVNFGVDYVGDYLRNPVCAMRSRVDYRNFTVTGTPLDAAVGEAAKSSILAELDFQVATRFNSIAGSGAIARGSERCANWMVNPTLPTPTP